MTSIPANSAGILWSPGAWTGDTGRGGSVSRSTRFVGSWFEITVHCGSNPVVSFVGASVGAAATIAHYVDSGNGFVWYSVGVGMSQAGTGTVVLGGAVANTTCTFRVYYSYGGGQTKWTVSNFTIDSGSTVGTARTLKQWVLYVGDNQSTPVSSRSTSGYPNISWAPIAQAGYGSGSIYDYGMQTGDQRGFTVAGVENGNYCDASGNGQWSYVDWIDKVSLLDTAGHISANGGTGQQPALINVMLGEKDAEKFVAASTLTSAVTMTLTKLRLAAPSAVLSIQIWYGAYSTSAYPNAAAFITAIKAGVTAYKNANPSDTLVHLTDSNSTISTTYQSNCADGINPGTTASNFAAKTITPIIEGYLSGVVVTPPPPVVTPPVAAVYKYTVTLTNIGLNPIETFWFAWEPGQDYLPDLPTVVTSPTGWNGAVLGSPSTSDGYSIQWTTTTNALPVSSTITFVFTSATAPTTMLGASGYFPGIPVVSSTIYGGVPGSDAGTIIVPGNTAPLLSNALTIAWAPPVVVTPNSTLKLSAVSSPQHVGSNTVATLTGNYTINPSKMVFNNVDTNAGNYTPASNAVSAVLDATTKILTVTIANTAARTSVPLTFQDITDPSNLIVSNTIFYDVVAAPGSYTNDDWTITLKDSSGNIEVDKLRVAYGSVVTLTKVGDF